MDNNKLEIWKRKSSGPSESLQKKERKLTRAGLLGRTCRSGHAEFPCMTSARLLCIARKASNGRSETLVLSGGEV